MFNPVQPQPCEILGVKKESAHEWTFRVAADAKPAHGQFMQLSNPRGRGGWSSPSAAWARSPT